jgi:hypothetical protein
LSDPSGFAFVRIEKQQVSGIDFWFHNQKSRPDTLFSSVLTWGRSRPLYVLQNLVRLPIISLTFRRQQVERHREGQIDH